ncbi:MAG TPA: type II toxin-antitoxin system PemK/MazF family toxin [Candidatus Absconditabacterales bacterium]|nr:type II toxin-antitoxin system PemK/MazF family toxin [Candidatus Absconditabacterales bacterium]HMT27463.1 type II toxin-antitoxin system PemK/MazF family toxin [Candidatus Absconditabacterales bacterium]
MVDIKKYDIWLVDLDPTKGHEQNGKRPCIVYQNNLISTQGVSQTFLVIPLTSQGKTESPVTLFLSNFERYGLSLPSFALCFQMKAVDVSGFVKKIGSIGDAKTKELLKIKLFNTLDFDDDF